MCGMYRHVVRILNVICKEKEEEKEETFKYMNELLLSLNWLGVGLGLCCGLVQDIVDGLAMQPQQDWVGHGLDLGKKDSVLWR